MPATRKQQRLTLTPHRSPLQQVLHLVRQELRRQGLLPDARQQAGEVDRGR